MPGSEISAVVPGAEAWSYTTPDSREGRAPGALVLHGFTGNPSSVRILAQAFAAEGFHVELPRLPGHGTTVEDMLTTGWGDWSAATEDAYERLAGRARAIVAAGLSMGAALTLSIALRHPEVAGIVCINPATQPWPCDVREAIDQVLAEGLEVLPAVGSDIADPDVTENSYDRAPVRPLISFLDEGLTPMAARYGELRMPLLLFTSRHDHVVEPTHSEHLAATYGGPVDHRWLERSYHVATIDFDRDVIALEAATFAGKVTGR
jgi:carboxylesterase